MDELARVVDAPVAQAEATDAKPQPVPVPPSAVILRLVHEAVASRIRFRALLNVLHDAGALDYAEYVREYADLRDRDVQALVATLVLKPEDFAASFAQWFADDNERYAIAADGGPKNPSKPRSRRKRKVAS